MAGLYYVGRIDGRQPKLDIEVLLAKELVKMSAPDFGREASRCEGHLTEKGKELAKIGEDLVELGQKMRDQKNPASNR